MTYKTCCRAPQIRLSVLLTAMLASYAQAQPDAAAAPAIPVVLVTAAANATEVSVNDAPASVSVITAAELARMPTTDLNDVLRRSVGLSQATTPDGGTSLQIRGMPQQYTLLLVDGQRMGSASDTFDRYSRNELNWIPVESIERIEIVRGPMSSVYGSDAMGGVINIITKQNSRKWAGSVTAAAELNEDGYRGNDYKLGFSVNGPASETVRIRAQGEQRYRQADTRLPHGVDAFRWGGGREGSKLQSYGGQMTWLPVRGHRLTLDVQAGTWRTLPGPAADRSNPGGFLDYTRGPANMRREATTVSYAGQHGDVSSKVALSRTRYQNATDAPVVRDGRLVPELDTAGLPATDRRGNPLYQRFDTAAIAGDLVFDASLSAPLQYGFKHMLTVGTQWQRSQLDNPNSVGSLPNADGIAGLSYKETRSSALFAEDQIFLLEQLSLTLGLRRDQHDRYGGNSSARAYMVYHPTKAWTLRGGLSEAFRAPTLRQSNPNFVSQSAGAGCLSGYQGGGCYTRGSAALAPETSRNWEFGASWESDGRQANIGYFSTRFQDKIQERALGYLPGNPMYWQEYVNVANAQTRGIEMGVTWPLLKSLTLRTNLTHMLKAENTATGEPLSVVPRWSANSTLDWQVSDNLDAYLLAEFTGKQVNLDWRNANNDERFGEQRIAHGFALFDAGFNYKLSKRMRLSGGVKNVFDRNPNGSVDEGNNFYTPGRRYFAALSTTFQ
ncbi:TonB-dependent receptor domain-containing protein [Massilia sp. BSC265]|uniref:TonB-dependent receptor domain-containing protein n=1 Tax=Massilia sp. BSC265 TaxID=1549812 RepID=UPI0009DD005D|nr:TonB-dependent receptor [Massilia sp. BSC265]